LGIDLGSNSLGWAIVLEENEKPTGLVDAGVRVFEAGVDESRGTIERGKDASRAKARRDARLQRRQLMRRARRVRLAFRILQQSGLLPGGADPADSKQRHELLNQLDKDLAAKHLPESDRIAGHLLPYRLRAKAIHERLEPHELGRALLHVAQRRGFKSNRKTGKRDDEGVVKKGISQLEQEMKDAGAETLGEFYAKIDPEARRIRTRYTSRKMYENEFERIWTTQAAFHPVLLTDQVKRRLYRAIFHQRPISSQKGLVGRCELEPKSRRAAAARLVHQWFRLLQRVNDLEFICPDGEVLRLTDERMTAERQRLIDALETLGDIEFSGKKTKTKKQDEQPQRPKKPKKDSRPTVRSLLGLSDEHEINLERGGEKKLPGNRTNAAMAEIFGPRWFEFSDAERDRIIDDVLSIQNDAVLERRGKGVWGLSEEDAKAFAEVELEPDYASLSCRAMTKLLPALKNGEQYATARRRLYPERFQADVALGKLPPALKAVPQLRNPAVARALTELRTVINAIIRVHGKPELIRIELARDLKRPRKVRERIWEQNRENQTAREGAKVRFLQEMGIAQPRGDAIEKVLLAEECNWKCPYTGRPISMRALLGDSPEFDVEHIIPFSRSLDNSFMNKTLCYHDENRNRKRNRTPFEAYGVHESLANQWHEIMVGVRNFQGSAGKAKLRRFEMEEIPDDFAASQLNDTRYASRLSADYLGLLYGGRVDESHEQRVQPNTGGVTAFLRAEWGLNFILNDGPRKERKDHRHHAVDAICIALSSAKIVKMLSDAASRAVPGRRFDPVEPPWPTFDADARKAIEAINVSYRVSRRVSGPLHEETNYSPPFKVVNEDHKLVEYRHVRKPLDMLSRDRLDAIVDPVIRQRVLDKLTELNETDPKKAFKLPENHPVTAARDGRKIPIHKVRIREKVAAITVGGDTKEPDRKTGRERYVSPGSNHHMEILAVQSKNAEVEKWEGVLVSMFDAAKRVLDKRPVVKRDHGDGKRFLFSLGLHEIVRMDENGTRMLCRITGISEGLIELRPHTEARPGSVLKKIKGGRIFRTADTLRKSHAEKVTVDPLGRVHVARD